MRDYVIGFTMHEILASLLWLLFQLPVVQPVESNSEVDNEIEFETSLGWRCTWQEVPKNLIYSNDQ